MDCLSFKLQAESLSLLEAFSFWNSFAKISRFFFHRHINTLCNYQVSVFTCLLWREFSEVPIIYQISDHGLDCSLILKIEFKVIFLNQVADITVVLFIYFLYVKYVCSTRSPFFHLGCIFSSLQKGRKERKEGNKKLTISHLHLVTVQFFDQSSRVWIFQAPFNVYENLLQK